LLICVVTSQCCLLSDTFYCVVTGLSMRHVGKAVVSRRDSLVKIARLVSVCCVQCFLQLVLEYTVK